MNQKLQTNSKAYRYTNGVVLLMPRFHFHIQGGAHLLISEQRIRIRKKEIQKEVLETYKAMYKIIKNRDINGYLALVREREELITSCLLYKTNEKTLRQKEFVGLIQNNAYEVQPLVPETFKIEFQGYGKLVMLLHKVDGEGVIRLQNKKDPKDTIYLDFRLQRKTKGDPLTVI